VQIRRAASEPRERLDMYHSNRSAIGSGTVTADASAAGRHLQRAGRWRRGDAGRSFVEPRHFAECLVPSSRLVRHLFLQHRQRRALAAAVVLHDAREPRRSREPHAFAEMEPTSNSGFVPGSTRESAEDEPVPNQERRVVLVAAESGDWQTVERIGPRRSDSAGKRS
jgi:hypothetical protein